MSCHYYLYIGFWAILCLYCGNIKLFCLHHNLQGCGFSISEDVAEVKNMLEKEVHMRKEAEEEVNKLKSQLGQSTDSGVYLLWE